MEQIQIKNVSFGYSGKKDKSLDDVSLVVEKGEFLLICGKSGSGKTTLLRHLKPALKPYGEREGEILYEGRPIEDMGEKEQAEKIGFVMQDPESQIVTDKVWHELAFGLENLGCEQEEMRRRVAEMAEYFGITSWFTKDVSELSGGQKQLLNLASIMVMQPDVLILDEPTSQLDPIAAADFLNTIRKINQDLGTTILMTEHRLEEVIPIVDRVIVMDEGKVRYLSRPKDIGKELFQNGDEMFMAMPSPIQIFYGSSGQGECPVNVREGRKWLDTLSKESWFQHGLKVGEEKGYEFGDNDCKANGLAIEKNPVIEIKETWFRYEKEEKDVLRGVNLSIPKGRFSVIMGGNGSGKSTLLKNICGVCRPYRGKIYVNGKLVWKYRTSNLFPHGIAMLPQEPKSLFVKKTVLEELMEMTSGKECEKEQVYEIARLVEIEHLLKMHPYDLSGGEQQRVALGKILMGKPNILLLDEPTKGIDCFFKEKLARILKKLMMQGVTILMVSHDIAFCAKHADYVSLFFDGTVISTSDARSFFRKNNFYTTQTNRMFRRICPQVILVEDAVSICSKDSTKCNSDVKKESGKGGEL